MLKGHTTSTLKSRISLVLRRFHHQPLELYAYSDGHMDLLRRSKIFSRDINYSSRISSLHTHIFSNRFVRTSAVMAIFALVLLTSAILIPIYNNIDITEAATGTAKESSLSFNLTNSTASVDLSVNDNNGTFATSSTNVGFNISTTNYTGYTLSISSSNNTQTLVNESNNSYTLSSITSATSYDTFSDDTTAASSYNGKWGYLPSKINSSTNTNYLPAPTTTASTLDKTTTANSTANSYTIGIGTRASYTQPAGTYTGTYTLNVVANSITYTIQYNKGNTTDTVGSLPNTQSSSTSNTSITLSNNTPTRTGYDFNGWCMGTISTTNGVDSCTGAGAKTFAKGGSFGMDQTTTNTTTLYAMWTPKKYTITIKTNTGISSVSLNGTNCTNTSGCNVTNLSYGQSYTLTATPATGYDFVSWANSANLGTIRSTTTASTTFTVGLGVTTLTPSAQRHLYTVTVSRSNASSVTFTNKNNTDSSRCPTRSNISATSTTLCYGVVYTLTMNNPAGYSLVSWATAANGTLSSTTAANPTYSVINNTTLTATAGRTLYTVNLTRNNVASVTFTNTSTDISRCPTRSNVSAASTTLCYGVNYTITMSPATGYSFSSWATATNGTLGSTSAASTTYKVTGVSTLTASANNYGKCTNPATCMQLYTKATCQANASSANVTLTDARDGNTYTVRYINGNCWMTQNLRITGTIFGTYSNFSASSVNISVGTLSSGDSYTEPRTATASNTATYGAWYNYCAASARTICVASSTTTATQDICPLNWHLPSSAEMSSVNRVSTFGPVTGGRWYKGTLNLTTYGSWWGSPAASLFDDDSLFVGYSETGRENISYHTGDYLRGGSGSEDRGHGIYVRCVRSS